MLQEYGMDNESLLEQKKEVVDLLELLELRELGN
jgi:hypothetical protein